jgi:glycine hydroxymethyltransferase
MAIARTLKAFNVKDTEWGVAVQPLSGSPANFCAYTALIKPGGKIMGMSLYCGGHLTHGFQTETKKVSATSVYFTSQSYNVYKL